MTIEDIKEWRKEDHVNVFTTDFPLNEDDVANIDWLIAEVERLQENVSGFASCNRARQAAEQECAELRVVIHDNTLKVIDLFSKMERIEAETVQICAEIADRYSTCEGIAQKIRDEIKKEFGV